MIVNGTDGTTVNVVGGWQQRPVDGLATRYDREPEAGDRLVDQRRQRQRHDQCHRPAAGKVALTINGGVGKDTIIGSQGNDTILAATATTS